MNIAATATAIFDFTGCYGPTWTQGVLSDHVATAQAAGMVVRATGSGRRWVTGPDGGDAFPVLCSEIRMIATEDGPMTGRCGQPVVDANGTDQWCPGHNPGPGWDDLCEHQMPAWLCAGPGHYPMEV
jgi:hypothetical protein